MIPPALRNKLVQAGAAGAVAIATVLIMHFEGYRSYPYFDTGQVLTVCWGHTGRDIEMRNYSRSECEAFLAKDVAIAEDIIRRNVKVPLPEYTRGALIAFTFNVGETQFRRSALLQKLNAGQRASACEQLRRWVYDNGRRLNGLVSRRDAETWTCKFNGAA